jgi:hypothetical protein
MISNQESSSLSSLVLQHRLQLSLFVLQKCGWRVTHGPFKGLRFPHPTGGWSNADLGGMALGIYEKEVLDLIASTPEAFDLFINLGAADGYYAVGTLTSGWAKEAICFESDLKAHRNILELAQLNKVEGQLKIFGEASSNFLDHIPSYLNSKSLLLSDIEGGEFNIFSSHGIFEKLAKCTVIIEIHARHPECLQKASSIIERSSATHSYMWLTTSSRDLSSFRLLDDLDDTNRWLLCSEGRPYRMSWLALKPL